MEQQPKKRKFKQYLEPDSTASVPVMTQWRKRRARARALRLNQLATLASNANADDSCDDFHTAENDQQRQHGLLDPISSSSEADDDVEQHDYEYDYVNASTNHDNVNSPPSSSICVSNLAT